MGLLESLTNGNLQQRGWYKHLSYLNSTVRITYSA